MEPGQPAAKAGDDGVRDALWKTRRERLQGGLDSFWRLIGDVFKDAAHSTLTRTAERRGLKEMPGGDVFNDIVPAFAHGHRKLHLVALDLMRIDVRLGGHDVVEGREAKVSPRRDLQTEVLGVAVRGTEQPEHQLRFQKEALIEQCIVAAAQELKYGRYSRTAFGLVLSRWRDRECLTAIFLRQA